MLQKISSLMQTNPPIKIGCINLHVLFPITQNRYAVLTSHQKQPNLSHTHKTNKIYKMILQNSYINATRHVTQIHQNINLYQYIHMINLADVFTVLRNITFIWHICLYIHVTALSGTSSLDGAIPLASRDNSPLHFRTRPRWVDSCHFHDLLISPWRWTEINNKRNHFL